jgi:hypothetical protein
LAGDMESNLPVFTKSNGSGICLCFLMSAAFFRK